MFPFMKITRLGSLVFQNLKLKNSFSNSCISFAKDLKNYQMANFLVFVDCEMTGLNFKKDRIMEIGCVITDTELMTIDELNIIIHQDNEVLSSMDEWCTETHGKTGLTEACRKSQITEAQAETEVLNFLKKFVAEKSSPLAGNSVYADRLFLKEYMPRIDSFLHYRLIDVSTIKELAKRWNPKIFANAPDKKLVHRAVDDIYESINELKYYKQFMFHEGL